MTANLYVADWAPYQYLMTAMLRAKPMPELLVHSYSEMDHPIAREKSATTPFFAYQDEGEQAVFTFLAVAETLDRRFPDIRLFGETPAMRGRVRSVCHIIEEGFTLLTASHLADLPGYDGPMWHGSSRAPEALLETYVKKLGFVERCAEDVSFLLGDRPYLPDVILAASCWYAEDLGLPPVPNGLRRLEQWHRRNGLSGMFAR